MIGMALVTKHAFGNLSTGSKVRVSCSFHCRRCFNSCTLVTRWNPSMLKMNVGLVYQMPALKIRVGCGNRGIYWLRIISKELATYITKILEYKFKI